MPGDADTAHVTDGPLRGSRGWWWVGGAIALLVLGLGLAWPSLLQNGGYMPHGHCYLWQPRLVALHLTSDLAIGSAYVAIAVTLAYLVHRTRHELPFNWMVIAFGVFIIACGTTHFLEAWTLWHPTYWLSGNVKLLTAIASVGTAVALPPLVPRIRALLRAEEIAAHHEARLERQTTLLAEEQRARARAEEADRAKDQFLAMVSHELRTPLSPVLAWGKLLVSGALPADKQRSAAEAIVRNATAQAQLVDDLLDVSRIVTGKLRLDVRPTDVARVLEAAIESVRPSADAKTIRLATVLDPRAGLVLGDPDRLQQVFWNLLSNAIKFTPRGGRVQASLERVNSHVEVSVADTGIGLDTAALGRVFTRFWQADEGYTRRHGGMGLGLSIVRHLVELHGGEVEAHSSGPDQGATFLVKLPIMVTTEHVVPGRRHPSAGSAVGPSTYPDLHGVSALVVDDDPDSNDMLQTLLTRCGADVRVAGSVQQALEILDHWQPTVVVSDIGMPGEDGFSLITRLRARPAARGGRVPAIALTAYARVEDRVKVLTAGFQLHVSKPVDPAELAAAVAALSRGGEEAGPLGLV